MKRRTFMAAGAFGALAARTRPLYTLERFFCRDAAELRRLAETMSAATLCLEAVAAAHAPQLAVLREAALPSTGAHHLLRAVGSEPVYELRTYTGPGAPRLQPLFERAGIRPVLAAGPGMFLIPFASLAARERAWSAAAADPDWLRARSAIHLSEVAVYRVMPAGRPGNASPPESLRTP